MSTTRASMLNCIKSLVSRFDWAWNCPCSVPLICWPPRAGNQLQSLEFHEVAQAWRRAAPAYAAGSCCRSTPATFRPPCTVIRSFSLNTRGGSTPSYNHELLDSVSGGDLSSARAASVSCRNRLEFWAAASDHGARPKGRRQHERQASRPGVVNDAGHVHWARGEFGADRHRRLVHGGLGGLQPRRRWRARAASLRASEWHGR